MGESVSFASRSAWRTALPAVALLLSLSWARPVDAQVVINELLAANRQTNRDEDGDSSDWVELVNAGAVAVDLEGWSLSDSPAEPRKWVFPPATLQPGEYLLVWCSGKDRAQIPAELITEPGSTIPFTASLVSLEAEWRYTFGVPQAEGPPSDWMLPSFDDSSWPTGRPGFGFGDGDDTTVLPEGIGAAFLRHEFTVAPGVRPANLFLQVRFDDGFVMYLNGERLLSVNFPENEEPVFASIASRSAEASRERRFDLGDPAVLLRDGRNVVAFALLNRSPTSSDLSLIPELGTVPPVFHTNFRLDADGESVVLSTPDGRVADRVDFPPQIADQTFARSPDGEGPFLFHLEPTPAAANAGPSSSDPLVVGDTTFSVDRGFHDAPFDVEITTTTPGAIIRYTLDGSAPTENHGTIYAGPIQVADTTTLRAAAFKAGLRASNVDTQTYVFLETPEGGGVLNQSRRPPGFPLTWQGTSGSRSADYEMDPRIVSDTTSRFFDPRVEEGLLALPVMSLVLDRADLFDPRRGIYVNPTAAGPAWERPCSVEFFTPDGSREFQVNAGLRIQGNASRSLNRPKHNMRLLFKTIYGPGKLRFRLFKDSDVEEFDTIVLRGGNGDSWFHPNQTQQTRAQYIRDQWHRDTQFAMGQLTAHQIYASLYINGLYWGVYHIFERPNASFLASYLGGEEEEYDAFNVDKVVDGDMRAWNEMVALVNRGVRTLDDWNAVQEYLDPVNMIDFLLVNFYSGNVDWDHRNWYGGRRRLPGAQFKFFCWDAERTFWNFGENRVNLNNAARPTGLNQRMRQFPEYRILFADRAHRHLFNDGALTPEEADARWMARATEIEAPLSAEAARWGDNKRPSAPYTRDVEWAAELRSLRGRWFRQRTAVLLGQLRALGLYPRVTAPSFNQHGGRVARGFELVISAPAGTVLYTLDGTDPRLPGDTRSPEALESTGAPIALERTAVVMARALDGGEWSALNEATFVVEGTVPLRITEIHYHPAPPAGGLEADEFEFLELKNISGAPVELDGVRLEGGIAFDFTDSEIARLGPGELLVVVENIAAFRSRGDVDGVAIAGQYAGRLSNSGDELILRGPSDEELLRFTYSDSWYPETDGGGRSLVLVSDDVPVEELGSAASWKASALPGGSPGADEPAGDATGGQIPSDLNQDGRLDLSDAVRLLLYLFATGDDRPSRLPCGEGTLDDESNRSMLDANGDSAVNLADTITVLNYLFLAGDAPALGAECVELPRCPDRCAAD